MTCPTCRRIEPLVQGELDGLCGVYAIINAVRWLCPEGSGDELAEDLFSTLIRTIENYHERPMVVVWRGMDGALVRRLIKVAQRYVSETLGINLAHSNLAMQKTSVNLPSVWSGFAQALHDNQVAIFAISGSISHWTVAVSATPKMLNLFDSNEFDAILRSRTTLQRTNRRVQLLPDQIILMSRD